METCRLQAIVEHGDGGFYVADVLALPVAVRKAELSRNRWRTPAAKGHAKQVSQSPSATLRR